MFLCTNVHTWQWLLLIGISFSRGPFSGSMLNFRGVMVKWCFGLVVWIRIGFLFEKGCYLGGFPRIRSLFGPQKPSIHTIRCSSIRISPKKKYPPSKIRSEEISGWKKSLRLWLGWGQHLVWLEWQWPPIFSHGSFKQEKLEVPRSDLSIYTLSGLGAFFDPFGLLGSW